MGGIQTCINHQKLVVYDIAIPTTNPERTEVQSDSFPGVPDQHDASWQSGADALLAGPLHPGTAVGDGWYCNQ